MMRLIGLSISPWSEKARWALDHHRLSYAWTEYLPMIGAPALRFFARRPFGRVTVPVLLDGDRAYSDSLAIARHADEVGDREPLFISHQVEEWNTLGERALDAGRALGMLAMQTNSEAIREQTPAFVPPDLRGAMEPFTALGVGHIVRKYRARGLSPNGHREALVTVLERLRAGLRGKDYLLGDFSYADVAMAVTLQFVAPVDDRYVRLGPQTRACFTQPDLAERFGDLVAWRETIYAAHRRPI